MVYKQCDKNNLKDKIAWTLCQIFDDDAPLRWTRFRFLVTSIIESSELMKDLNKLYLERKNNGN